MPHIAGLPRLISHIKNIILGRPGKHLDHLEQAKMHDMLLVPHEILHKSHFASGQLTKPRLCSLDNAYWC